ncbi:MAG: hypothetical protein ACSLFO_07430, partial [Acidimicrobiales bacterium]
AVLMLGAIGMHVKVKDPLKRSIPAISVFTGAAVSAILNGRDGGEQQGSRLRDSGQVEIQKRSGDRSE